MNRTDVLGFGSILVLLSLTGTGTSINQANAVDLLGEELSISTDFTFASKYVWHGYDIFDDHAAFQPSIHLDYRGFFGGVWGAWPAGSGFEELTELDLYFGYAFSLFEEKPYALDIFSSYTYFVYPKTNSLGDVQELALGISMPQLINIGPSYLVPSYTVFYDWDGVQSEIHIDNGWFHTLGLSYALPASIFLKNDTEQTIDFSCDITYNEGVFGSDSGWSHSTFGISSTFTWSKFYLTPSINYQWSFEDTVNDEDEFYASISVGYTF